MQCTMLFTEMYLAVDITLGLISTAVGLEHHENIIRDVEQALWEIV